MNANQLITDYGRLQEAEQAKFDTRYRSMMRFRKRSRSLLKEMRSAGFAAQFKMESRKERAA